MKKQKARMFFKDIMSENKSEAKQFKTATGSPILYTRLRKHRGIYYPLAKHHPVLKGKGKPKQNPKHVCVVYSKLYGREVYGNVDIWPDDEQAREKLLQKLHSMSMDGEFDDDEDDVGIDIPKAIEDMADNNSDSNNENSPSSSPEDRLRTKSTDDTRHVTIVVTDTSLEECSSPTSGDHQIHPAADGEDNGDGVDGEWPFKRSQSVNSRDNPFLPGGNLSKEADEILSHATIIRDTFILQELDKAKTEEERQEILAHNNKIQQNDNKSNGNTWVSHTPVNESITKNEVIKSEYVMVQNASPTKTKAKENGKVDTENFVNPGTGTRETLDNTIARKKQKKCCSIM